MYLSRFRQNAYSTETSRPRKKLSCDAWAAALWLQRPSRRSVSTAAPSRLMTAVILRRYAFCWRLAVDTTDSATGRRHVRNVSSVTTCWSPEHRFADRRIPTTGWWCEMEMRPKQRKVWFADFSRINARECSSPRKD